MNFKEYKTCNLLLYCYFIELHFYEYIHKNLSKRDSPSDNVNINIYFFRFTFFLPLWNVFTRKMYSNYKYIGKKLFPLKRIELCAKFSIKDRHLKYFSNLKFSSDDF